MRVEKNKSEKHIVKILQKNEVVGLFQGSSEAGPRALGNRSLIMSPKNKSHKKILNNLKGRELFRPLAASVLEDQAKNWFNMLNMDSSPYMSFSFKIKQNKKNKVPAIVHVDDSCRVQTVNKDQNKNFYNLILEFYKKTKVPLLINTSFNSKDEPIVETVQEAIDCCKKIKVKFIYFPQAKILVTL